MPSKPSSSAWRNSRPTKQAACSWPAWARLVERAVWKQRGLREGWLKVSKDTLAARQLQAGKPDLAGSFAPASFTERSRTPRPPTATSPASDFFDRLKDTYGDRIFAFDHFSVSRTPDENARMLLEGLPDQTTTFDVVTHSRGGLVLRNLVERSDHFGICRAASSSAARCSSRRRTTARRSRRRSAGTTPSAGSPTCSSCFRTTRSRPAPRSSPTGSCGLPTMRPAICPACTRWTARRADRGASSAARAAGRRVLGAGRQLPSDRRRCCSVCWMSASISSSRPPTISSCRPKADGASIARPPRSFRPVAIGCFGPGGNLDGDYVTHVSFFRAAGHRRTFSSTPFSDGAAARLRRSVPGAARSSAGARAAIADGTSVRPPVARKRRRDGRRRAGKPRPTIERAARSPSSTAT